MRIFWEEVKKIPTEKQGLFLKNSGGTGCLTLTIGCVHVGCVVYPPRLLGLQDYGYNSTTSTIATLPPLLLLNSTNAK